MSDADVLIKLIRAGQLGLLCTVMPSIVIPEWVRREVLRKVGLGPADVFASAIREGRIEVIDTDSDEDSVLSSREASQSLWNHTHLLWMTGSCELRL